MKIISIGLLLAVIGPALGLETQYLPPAHPEYTLQSLEYQGSEDVIVPAHSLDEDGYHYKVGNRIRNKREALQPATFDDLYAQSKDITQDFQESQFVGPSPDQIAVPSYDSVADDNYIGPAPDQIARPSDEQSISEQSESVQDVYGAPSAFQPVRQELTESTVLADDGYHYRTARRTRYRSKREPNVSVL